MIIELSQEHIEEGIKMYLRSKNIDITEKELSYDFALKRKTRQMTVSVSIEDVSEKHHNI